ncbi:MAG: hypothetical protein M1156_00035 [Candidatus Marsarchaeota archaeon]|jgi:hypothetical protein|nr:hypothetical protein [Candidatus Marsarchaeota archaeon]
MDHRDGLDENAYKKELSQEQEEQYDDFVTIDGKPFRIPYKIIREVTFSGVRKDEMVSMEHAARLQYRLMLLEPVIKAKVEFTKQKITVVYNPKTAHNRKEKISLEELISFFDKEGVHLNQNPRTERDFDYYNEMYKYQFDPPSIRERPPYGYTMDEWKSMKPEYTKKMIEAREKNVAKFKEWQNSYAESNPQVLADKMPVKSSSKPTLKEKLFGKKRKRREKEKQFWFHGAS